MSISGSSRNSGAGQQAVQASGGGLSASHDPQPIQAASSSSGGQAKSAPGNLHANTRSESHSSGQFERRRPGGQGYGFTERPQTNARSESDPGRQCEQRRRPGKECAERPEGNQGSPIRFRLPVRAARRAKAHRTI